MKISKEKLAWTNRCCGCFSKIPVNDTTFILTEICGKDGSIHFCQKCVKEIIKEFKSTEGSVNMIDKNIGSIPYETGDKIIIEAIVTDPELSFNYIGKALMNNISTADIGLQFENLIFSENRYKECISDKLRAEIKDAIGKAITKIDKLLE